MWTLSSPVPEVLSRSVLSSVLRICSAKQRHREQCYKSKMPEPSSESPGIEYSNRQFVSQQTSSTNSFPSSGRGIWMHASLLHERTTESRVPETRHYSSSPWSMILTISTLIVVRGNSISTFSPTFLPINATAIGLVVRIFMTGPS